MVLTLFDGVRIDPVDPDLFVVSTSRPGLKLHIPSENAYISTQSLQILLLFRSTYFSSSDCKHFAPVPIYIYLMR